VRRFPDDRHAILWKIAFFRRTKRPKAKVDQTFVPALIRQRDTSLGGIDINMAIGWSRPDVVGSSEGGTLQECRWVFAQIKVVR
jgi:hypothetical protein